MKKKKPKKKFAFMMSSEDFQALLDALASAKSVVDSTADAYLVAVGVTSEAQGNYDSALSALAGDPGNATLAQEVLDTNSVLTSAEADEATALATFTAAKSGLATALQAVVNATVPILPSVP